MTNKFIAYTRVSTQKQGAHGVSLTEQRRAISHYAKKHNLKIYDWYEEQYTAAKSGRPVFKQVMQSLRSSRGRTGLVMHKIDRGARNLSDWASIGEAIDHGIDVRFAHENLDLWSRGGRLTADIQAVIAADYIRNLREEVKKGMYGRLRQGLYPFGAPRGYLDQGSGRVKSPDPAIAPLIIQAFRLYVSGQYGLNALATELSKQGLVTKSGNALRPDALSKMLRNPFYKGEMKISGKLYQGAHQPLVTAELFECVQGILASRKPKRRRRHIFRYQRRLRCNTCDKCLLGEHQKTWVYYRCRMCRVCVREDRVLWQNHRFRVISRDEVSKYGQLEPWEKFDSSGVIEKPQKTTLNQRLY